MPSKWIPRRWLFQPSFRSASEKASWLSRRNKALWRAYRRGKSVAEERRLRKLRSRADGPGPNSSYEARRRLPKKSKSRLIRRPNHNKIR